MDSNVWLYSFTADERYGEACRSILQDIEESRMEAVVSAQVLAEVSGVLYRQFGLADTTKHVAGCSRIASGSTRSRPRP